MSVNRISQVSTSRLSRPDTISTPNLTLNLILVGQ